MIPSFSRPRVSDDHPYAEALFRTLTYCPAFPSPPLVDVEAARAWVTAFVAWYRHHHQHSAIQCVTPDDRHTGRDVAILAQRDAREIGRCRSTEPRLGNAPRPSLHRWWTFERSNRAVHGSAGGREAQ